MKNKDKCPETRCGIVAQTLQDTHTGSWRRERPIINTEKCNQCGICGLYCPVGVIETSEEKTVINYTYCKGCGICTTVCPKHSIEMTPEGGGQ